MNRYRLLLIAQFLVLSMLLTYQAFSAETIVLKQDQESYQLGLNLDYFEDAKGEYKLPEIDMLRQSNRFQRSQKKVPSFGYTRSVYWAYFMVENPLITPKKLLLELAHPFMKQVTLYYSVDGKPFKKEIKGLQVDRSENEIGNRNHIFEMEFPGSSSTRFYMRFENEGPMSFPLTLWNTKAHLKKADLEQIVLGGFYGVVFALLIYNFTIFLSLRDKSYLFYVVFLGLLIVYQLTVDGIGYQYLWSGKRWFSLNSAIISWNLVLAAYIIFSRSFLNIKSYTTILDNLLKFIVGMLVLNAILSQFWDMIWSLKIAFLAQTVGTLLLILISVLGIRNNSRPAKLYFGAMVFLLTGTILTLLKNSGVLPQNLITVWGVHFGTTAEVILLSIGLADRINEMRKEKFIAQREAIEAHQEALVSKQLSIDTLKKTEKRIQQIFDNAVEGIFQFSENHQLVFSNPAMAVLFGYESESEMLSSVKHIETLFKNHNDYNRIYESLANNESYIHFEMPFMQKGNSEFFGTISVQKVSDDASKEIFAEGMILDITDRRLREKAERELEIAEKTNAAQSEFLAVVSHELRTPMHGILGYARLGISRLRTATEETISKYFKEILSSGQRLLGILNDLLDLSKLEADSMKYQFGRESLSLLVRFVVNELDSILRPKEISVDFTPPNFDDTAVMDKDKIIQVIRNLIANSVRFSKEQNEIMISIEKSDARYLFSIIDNGMGIPEAELEQIFDKFVQSSKTKAVHGGTGLGLSISKKIIEDHGGRIWAENNPTGGAIFRFQIPLVQG